jgi:hypothetical protein
LAWLTEIGFEGVEVIWKRCNFAVCGGLKPDDWVALSAGYLMISAFINPHGLCFPSGFKAVLLIELNCASVGDKNVLMKTLIFSLQVFQYLCPDAAALIRRKYKQVRVVNDKIPIRQSVPEPDKLLASPS